MYENNFWQIVINNKQKMISQNFQKFWKICLPGFTAVHITKVILLNIYEKKFCKNKIQINKCLGSTL